MTTSLGNARPLDLPVLEPPEPDDQPESRPADDDRHDKDQPSGLQLLAAGSNGAGAPGAGPTAPTLPTLRVEPWHDPVVDKVGHDPRSTYVEMYWLPVLGPSTTWLLRRFAAHLEVSPGGVELDAEDLARGLGLGERFGPNAPFARTLKRCVDFEMAEWRPDALAVRRRLPPLARRHLRRLPATLQEHHAAYQEAELGRPAADKARRYGERLALILFEHGDDFAAVEQQLTRWSFAPALASQCAAWAAAQAAAGSAHEGTARTTATAEKTREDTLSR